MAKFTTKKLEVLDNENEPEPEEEEEEEEEAAPKEQHPAPQPRKRGRRRKELTDLDRAEACRMVRSIFEARKASETAKRVEEECSAEAYAILGSRPFSFDDGTGTVSPFRFVPWKGRHKLVPFLNVEKLG